MTRNGWVKYFILDQGGDPRTGTGSGAEFGTVDKFGNVFGAAAAPCSPEIREGSVKDGWACGLRYAMHSEKASLFCNDCGFDNRIRHWSRDVDVCSRGQCAAASFEVQGR